MLGHANVLSAWAPMIAVGLAGLVLGICVVSALRQRTARITVQHVAPEPERGRLSVLAEFVLQRHEQQ